MVLPAFRTNYSSFCCKNMLLFCLIYRYLYSRYINIYAAYFAHTLVPGIWYVTTSTYFLHSKSDHRVIACVGLSTWILTRREKKRIEGWTYIYQLINTLQFVSGGLSRPYKTSPFFSQTLLTDVYITGVRSNITPLRYGTYNHNNTDTQNVRKSTRPDKSRNNYCCTSYFHFYITTRQ